MHNKRPGEDNTDAQNPAKKAKIGDAKDAKAEPKKGTILIDIDGTVFYGKISADIEKNREHIQSVQDIVAIINQRELIGEAKEWNTELSKLVKTHDIYFVSRNDHRLKDEIAKTIKEKMALDQEVFDQLHFDCKDEPKTNHIGRCLGGKATLEEKLKTVYLDNDYPEAKNVMQTGLLLAEGCPRIGWVNGALPELQRINQHFDKIDARIAQLKSEGQLNEMAVKASNEAYLKAEAGEHKKEKSGVSGFTFIEDFQSTGKSVDEVEPVQDNTLKLDLSLNSDDTLPPPPTLTGTGHRGK